MGAADRVHAAVPGLGISIAARHHLNPRDKQIVSLRAWHCTRTQHRDAGGENTHQVRLEKICRLSCVTQTTRKARGCAKAVAMGKLKHRPDGIGTSSRGLLRPDRCLNLSIPRSNTPHRCACRGQLQLAVVVPTFWMSRRWLAHKFKLSLSLSFRIPVRRPYAWPEK